MRPNSRTGGLAQIANDSLVITGLRRLSLEDAARRYKNFPKKKVYYVDTDGRGMRLFGIVGNSVMFGVTEEVYEAIGKPSEGSVVRASVLLEHYKKLNQG